MIAAPGVNVSRFNVGVDPKSFKLLCKRITSGSSTSIVLVFYRPGSDPITSAFFDDLSETHLDHDNDSNARQLTDLFDAFEFVARNAQPTHVLSELLNVVATHQDLPSPRVATYETGLFDHQLLQHCTCVEA